MDITPEGEGLSASETDKHGVLAIFFWEEAPPDLQATSIEGRAVASWKPKVRIICPGAKLNQPIEPLNDEHKARWPRAWAQFNANQSGDVNGTPLVEFPLLTRFQVAHIRKAGLLTVEMLAHVPDAQLDVVITHALRERARQWLSGASETEKDLRRELAELQAEVKDLAIRNDQLQQALEARPADEGEGEPEPATPKRGRPRKAA